jgi:hypothetical protein
MLLGDTPFSSLSSEQRNYARQVLGGSLVSSLIDQYGLPKVLALFSGEAEGASRRAESQRQELDDLNGRLGEMGISLSIQTERTSNPPNDPHLIALLKVLGYDTPEHFVDLGRNSGRIDTRPEGAIACTAVDYADSLHQRQLGASPTFEQATDSSRVSDVHEERRQEPSFIEVVTGALESYRAQVSFGPDFSASGFVDQWRQSLLQSFSPQNPMGPSSWQ